MWMKQDERSIFFSGDIIARAWILR